MRGSRGDDSAEPNYETLRGRPAATIANMIRSEKIKLREAAQEAVSLLESNYVPTREYLDYMWRSDVGMTELRTRMARLRERIAELEAINAESSVDIL